MTGFSQVLKILLRFVVIYIVLVLLYQLYLNNYDNHVVDPFTRWVAKQVAFLQNIFGFPTNLVDSLKLHSVVFQSGGKFTTRMVEGCNVMSVTILFSAFTFSVYKGANTFLFVLAGLIILHILNISRIVLLNIIFFKYPRYENIGHDYIFPAIIYSGMISLWMVWINYFALKKLKKFKSEMTNAV